MKQADGRYRKKITVGTRADGSKIIKYVSGKTKKELEKKAAEIRKHYIGGEEIKRDVLFLDYSREWFKTWKAPSLSLGSLQTYDAVFRRHIYPYIKDRRVSAITAADLQSILNRMSGMGRSTIGYAYAILVGVMRRAYVDGVIDRDVTVGLTRPQATSHSRRALTDEETAAALKVGHEHPEGLLLLLLYYTGMRIGEAIGLKWMDVDLKAGIIHVLRDADYRTNELGALKTKNAKRDIPIPAPLREVLKKGIGFVIQAPETTGFLPQATLKRRWKRLMTAMYQEDPSIESNDGRSILTPHYFRHNYASVLYNAGVDMLSAQKLMGHADVKTTLTIYTHLADAAHAESVDKLNEAFRLPNGLPAHKNTVQ